jgi:hypothetical protein
MAIAVRINQTFSKEDLVDVFLKFCTAYQIASMKSDHAYLREKGFPALEQGVDYELCKGITFRAKLSLSALTIEAVVEDTEENKKSEQTLRNLLSKNYAFMP